MSNTDLKSRLQNKQLALGSWITLAHPAIAEIMARAGFDWLAVDLEHSVITIREAEELNQLVRAQLPAVGEAHLDLERIAAVDGWGSRHGVEVLGVDARRDAGHDRLLSNRREAIRGRRREFR